MSLSIKNFKKGDKLKFAVSNETTREYWDKPCEVHGIDSNLNGIYIKYTNIFNGGISNEFIPAAKLYRFIKVSNGGNMFDSVKEYVKENRSILMTIGVALLVDHLVFGGAFREKVKSIIDSMLNTAQKKLDKAE